jgi:AcrR family transcriptional regulator
MTAYSRAGVSALSIRSVASELGVAPNALYSHITSKDALIGEVIDRIIGEVDAPSPDTEWRQGLRVLMLRSRAVLLKHPTLMPEFLSRPARGANALRLGELMLQFLAEGGVLGSAAVAALRVLLVYTIGFVAQESPRATDPNQESRHEVSIRTFSADSQRPLSRAAAPHLAQHPGDAVFETGLEWLIHGIAGERR